MLTNFSVKIDPFLETAEITPFDPFDPDMVFINHVFNEASGAFGDCMEFHVSIDFINKFIHVTLEGSDEYLIYDFKQVDFRNMSVVYAVKDLADNIGLFEWDIICCGGVERYPKLEKRLRQLIESKQKNS